jgi:TRAP-type C4-dicarboxylate transport system permease large subunit
MASNPTINGVDWRWTLLPPLAILIVVLGIAVPLHIGEDFVAAMLAVLIAIDLAVVMCLVARAKRRRRRPS